MKIFWRPLGPGIILSVGLLGLAVLPFGCGKSQVQSAVETVPAGEQAGYGDDLLPALDGDGGDRLATFVSLPGIRTPLQVYTRQLVDRAAEEQIVISRHPEFGNLELFLISPRVVSSAEGSVADYRIVAQRQLNIDAETFVLQTQDLTGDGTTQEIFVSGKNIASDLQQVYVFELLISGVEKDVLGLRQIFYQEGSGSYEISFGDEGYFIVHQRLLDQSSYQLELTDLHWAAGSFVVRQVKIIDDSDKLSAKLKALYRGSAEDFFGALDGLWLRTESGKVSVEKELTGAVFLYFESETNEMLIYGDTIGLEENDQVIEAYRIVRMAKSLWNRLTLNTRNKYVYNIQSYFYVTLEDHDTIKLFALNGSGYAGRYKRVNAASYHNYQSQNMDNISAANFSLEGVFLERNLGWQYTFQPDKMILSKPDGKTWVGAYSLFLWQGRNYLQFNLSEMKSFAAYRRSYRVELEHHNTNANAGGTAALAALILYPVQLLRLEEVNNTNENVIRLERP